MANVKCKHAVMRDAYPAKNGREVYVTLDDLESGGELRVTAQADTVLPAANAHVSVDMEVRGGRYGYKLVSGVFVPYKG